MTTFQTTREIAASPAEVFAAIASPQRLATWWGPEGFRNTFELCEFRPGGAWEFTMHGPDGASYPNTSQFVEIDAPHKVVIDHTCAPFFRLTVELKAHGDATRVSWVQVFEDAQVAAAVAHIVVPANEQNLDRLAAEVATGSASDLISQRIATLADWRGDTLANIRKLIQQADPDVVEEWKWMGTPVWSHDGIVCTGETYKDKVKLTFAKGASLSDPAQLFNASLEGNARRAIDIHAGEDVDASAFQALFLQAVALNGTKKSKPAKKAKA
jgi:uncharacterized protein YndB with AHSA1/START domain